jgi:hypothetical protein
VPEVWTDKGTVGVSAQRSLQGRSQLLVLGLPRRGNPALPVSESRRPCRCARASAQGAQPPAARPADLLLAARLAIAVVMRDRQTGGREEDAPVAWVSRAPREARRRRGRGSVAAEARVGNDERRSPGRVDAEERIGPNQRALRKSRLNTREMRPDSDASPQPACALSPARECWGVDRNPPTFDPTACSREQAPELPLAPQRVRMLRNRFRRSRRLLLRLAGLDGQSRLRGCRFSSRRGGRRGRRAGLRLAAARARAHPSQEQNPARPQRACDCSREASVHRGRRLPRLPNRKRSSCRIWASSRSPYTARASGKNHPTSTAGSSWFD